MDDRVTKDIELAEDLIATLFKHYPEVAIVTENESPDLVGHYLTEFVNDKTKDYFKETEIGHAFLAGLVAAMCLVHDVGAEEYAESLN